MAKMKNSGIKWIGEIPEDWEIHANKWVMRKIKELCPVYKNEDILSLTMKGVIKRDLEAGGKMPTTFDGYQKLYPNNLLMCLFDIDVTPRCIGLIQQEGLASPAYSQFVLSEKGYAPYYYYYYLNLDYSKELLHLAKNLRHSLTEDQLGVIPVPVPPYEKQKAIVSAIESKTTKIDSLIANEEKQIEKLKSYKQSLITETVTKGLDKNAKMKDSGVEWIGEIPEGWECRKLKTLVTDIGDIDHYMPESVINGFPYVMTGDLKSNVSEIDFKKCKMVSKEEFDKLSKKIKAEKGDLIFARYATIGTVCFVDIDKEFLVSYSCVVIKIKKDELFGKYLNYYIQSNSFLEEAKKYTNSNTQGNVGISSLNEMLITLPELKKQNEIINFLDEKCTQIDKLISLKESKIEKLNAYKKSLIYEYVTGKKEA